MLFLRRERKSGLNNERLTFCVYVELKHNSGSFAALNMAGAEGESVKWVKTLSLSFPACCSAAMRYTSLQLTHVLWHSVSHALDSSVDWPWLITAGLYIKRRNQSVTFYPTNTMKMLPCWLYYKNEHMQCWVIPHAPVCLMLNDAFVWIYTSSWAHDLARASVQPRVVADVSWPLSGVSGDALYADLQ